MAGKHFCVAKRNDMNDDEINETPEKIEEIQASKGCADNKHASENPYAHLIKYPYHPKPSSNFKENYLCSSRRDEMYKLKSMSKNGDCEISKNDNIKDIHNKSAELEAMKHENEDLKCKLKSTETSLEEVVNKYNDAQEEIKHLKYDNECQRKQIKFQKNHLKLLKMSQGNNFKPKDSNNITSTRKKIDEVLEIAINKHDTNTSERKCDLENLNADDSTKRVLELEEQNRLMIQGLNELRNFLKKQCESQSVEPLKSNNCSQSPNRSSKKCAFSESFDLRIINPEVSTSDGHAARSRDYPDMLREMTKFNELMKEKRENIKIWEAINLVEDDNMLTNTDLNDINNPFIQSDRNSSCGSTFDINDENEVSEAETDSEACQNTSNLKKNGTQKNCRTAVDQNWQHFLHLTEMKGKTNKYHVGDEVPLESADCTDKTSHEISTKYAINDERSSLSNTTLIEQDIFDDEVSEYIKNYSSEISEVVPECSVDLPGHSTNMERQINW